MIYWCASDYCLPTCCICTENAEKKAHFTPSSVFHFLFGVFMYLIPMHDVWEGLLVTILLSIMFEMVENSVCGIWTMRKLGFKTYEGDAMGNSLTDIMLSTCGYGMIELICSNVSHQCEYIVFGVCLIGLIGYIGIKCAN